MSKQKLNMVSAEDLADTIALSEHTEVVDLGTATIVFCQNTVTGDCIAISTSSGGYAIIRR